ncbi:hypothetical protein BKI52_14815 [marine bacterium AO1-C]|nr:hypothetical protein BKI52_14815 [marine bacterium AO1-C]
MKKTIQYAITQLLLNQAQEVIAKPHSHYAGLHLQAQTPTECRNQDYQALATMTDISISTIKRFLRLDCQLNYQNQEKLLHFLGFTDWDTLVMEALQQRMKILL